MKKLISLGLALACVFTLAGCNNTKQEETSTYSFRGENEYFAISNGSIVLSDSEEVFDGGNLSVIKTDLFDGVAAYSATFYAMEDGAQRTLMSNSVIDYTGGSIHIEEDLGRISGDGIIVGGKVENVDELRENLWFELKTADLSGKKNAYQIQLTLTEVTN